MEGTDGSTGDVPVGEQGIRRMYEQRAIHVRSGPCRKQEQYGIARAHSLVYFSEAEDAATLLDLKID